MKYKIFCFFSSPLMLWYKNDIFIVVQLKLNKMISTIFISIVTTIFVTTIFNSIKEFKNNKATWTGIKPFVPYELDSDVAKMYNKYKNI